MFTTGGPILGVPTGRTMFGHSEVGLGGDADDDDDFFECFLADDNDISLIMILILIQILITNT